MHRIGPNVIIQTAHTLADRLGRDTAEQCLTAATPFSLESLPSEMVDERTANALMRHLSHTRGPDFMRSVMSEAGRRTGGYLLEHRIPGPARWLLPHLPRALAMRVLMSAVSRHTWTFAGSAEVQFTQGNPTFITILHCPLCVGQHSTVPMCDFYTGTFNRLLRELVHPDAWAEEISCEARGDAACRFLLGNGR
jgi:divinyl protochlorophyllide a 8-vinyl-reductase